VNGAVIDVKVIPRASRTALAGVRDGAVVVRLAAAPVDGKANAELIAFLASLLDLPKRDITIVSGESGRRKRVKISGMTADAVHARLGLA
jgi:uncharacterized protein (TIGR00251 family)